MKIKQLFSRCIISMTVLMTSMSFASSGPQQHDHGQIHQAHNQHQHQGHSGIGIRFFLPRFHPMRHNHHTYRYPSHRYGAWYR